MNEEYLWDRGGEPDPEIQQLENILGTLRYQPRPVEIPEALLRERRRSLKPLLAIAATLILTILATGLWLRLSTEKSSPHQQAEAQVTSTLPGSSQTATPNVVWAAWKSGEPEKSKPNQSPRFVANNIRRERTNPASTLKAAELAEALKAKEQLLIALRLTSEKLSFAQKKTQHPTAPNQIRNQHKIG